MTETAEEKLARFETVIGLQMQEITRLREENERLRAASNAHSVLREIYLDRSLPESLRAKAAQAALPHEVPRLTPQPPAIDVTAEPYEPLAVVVQRQRARLARLDAMPRRNIRVLANGEVVTLDEINAGNGQDDSSSN
jgi:hypothetical protein